MNIVRHVVLTGMADATKEFCRTVRPSEFVKNLRDWRLFINFGVYQPDDTCDDNLIVVDHMNPSWEWERGGYNWTGYVLTSDGFAVCTVIDAKHATITYCKYVGSMVGSPNTNMLSTMRCIGEGLCTQDLLMFRNTDLNCNKYDSCQNLKFYEMFKSNIARLKTNGADIRFDESIVQFAVPDNKYFVIIDGVHDQFFQEWMSAQSEKSMLRKRYRSVMKAHPHTRMFFLTMSEARKLLKFMKYAVRKLGIIYGDNYNPMKYYGGLRKNLTNRLVKNELVKRRGFDDLYDEVSQFIDSIIGNDKVIIAVKPRNHDKAALDVYSMRKKFWLTKYPSHIEACKFDCPFFNKKANGTMVEPIEFIIARV